MLMVAHTEVVVRAYVYDNFLMATHLYPNAFPLEYLFFTNDELRIPVAARRQCDCCKLRIDSEDHDDLGRRLVKSSKFFPLFGENDNSKLDYYDF